MEGTMEVLHHGGSKTQPSAIPARGDGPTHPPVGPPVGPPLTPVRNGGSGNRKSGPNTPGAVRIVRPNGLSDFSVGSRLEAKDFNDKWYAAKVVEVDWEEQEIFIHFEKWSIRFDEWIPMDSSRIRPITKDAEANKHPGKVFSVGDNVMATWTNNCKYPAKVVKTLPNDNYEVQFYDGFHKAVRGNKMSRMKEADFQSQQARLKVDVPPMPPPHIGAAGLIAAAGPGAALDPLGGAATPVGGLGGPGPGRPPPLAYAPYGPPVPLLMPQAENIGTKEQRKERKRKLNVAELFHKKRSRLEDKSASPSPTRVRNLEKKMGNPHSPLMGGAGLMGGSVVKLEPGSLSASGPSAQNADSILGTDPMYPADPLMVEGGLMSPVAVAVAAPVEEMILPKIPADRKKRKRIKKRKEGALGQGAQSSRKSNKVPLMTPIETECNIRWEDGEPQGEAAYVIDGAEGPRKSIIVDDRRLPEGWSKHAIRRQGGTSAGKWDVFLVRNGSASGSATDNGDLSGASSGIPSPHPPNPAGLPPPPHLAGGHAYGQQPLQRVKTLLPKVRMPVAGATAGAAAGAGSPARKIMSPPPPHSTTPQLLAPHPAMVDQSSGLQLNAASDGDGFKCPKEGCEKRFRKENLLQMHIKHYHPEYNRFMGSTPNVADLAYARTIGEPLSETPSRNRGAGPSFIERISRFEANQKAARSSPSPAGSPAGPVSASAAEGVNGTAVPPPPKPMSSIEARAPTLNLLLKRGPMRKDNGDGSIAAANAAAAWMVKNIGELPPPSPHPNDSRAGLGLGDASSPSDNAKYEENPLRITIRPSSRPATRPTTPDNSRDESDMSRDLQSPMLGDQSLTAPSPSSNSTSTSPSYFFKKKSQQEKPNADGFRREERKSASPIDQLRREELINCTCGYTEEDGLMIQCDLCLCWQHGMCNNIEREEDVPDKYVCQICLHPMRERRSRRFVHDQSWLKDGILPSFKFITKTPDDRKHREDLLKRSHDICGTLLQMQHVIHSLRVKVEIAEQKDHPKLYLWANSWVKEPPPSCPTPPASPVSPSSKSPILSRHLADGTPIKLEPKLENELGKESELEKGKSLLQEALLNGSPIQPQHQQMSSGAASGSGATSGAGSGPGLDLPLSETLFAQIADAVEDKLRAPEMPVVPPVPQPEAPIDPFECRLKLLDHIEHFQNQLDARLNSMEEHVAALESEDPDVTSNESAEFFPQTKQAVQMLLRDLLTVRNFAALS